MKIVEEIEEFLNENLGKAAEKKLDKAYKVYMNIVEKVAREEFKRTLLPFLKKRNWSFLSGMGTWWIGGDKMIHPEDHPRDTELQEIAKLLDIEIPGIPTMSLSDFMPDYKRK